jgi:ribosomal protein L37AE/L43A
MPKPHLLEPNYLTTRTCYMISAMETSALNLLIEYLLVPHSYIIWQTTSVVGVYLCRDNNRLVIEVRHVGYLRSKLRECSLTHSKRVYRIYVQLHKCPCVHRYIAGSAKCYAKSLFKLLTSILSTLKIGLQSYCNTCYSRGGVNQME